MINENAITVDVSFYRYAPTMQAKEAGEIVGKAKGIDSRVTKGVYDLIPKEYTEPLRKAESEARKIFDQDSPRCLVIRIGPHTVLPTAVMFKFQEEWQKISNQWSALKQDFLDRYEGEILPCAQDRFRSVSTGSLVVPASKWLDTREKVAQRIRVDYHQYPFPDPSNVQNLKHLNDQFKSDMQESARSYIEGATAEAQKQLRKRLGKVLKDFTSKMKSYEAGPKGKKMYASIVDNIGEVVGLIPKLMVTPDDELLSLCAEAQRVSAWDVEVLKESHDARKEASVTADSILSAMAL